MQYKKNNYNRDDYNRSENSSGRMEGQPHSDARENNEYWKEKLKNYKFHRLINFHYEKSFTTNIFNPIIKQYETIENLGEPIYVMIYWKSSGQNWYDIVNFHDHGNFQFKKEVDDLLTAMERKRMCTSERTLEELRNGW